jgi:hypothetical protein
MIDARKKILEPQKRQSVRFMGVEPSQTATHQETIPVPYAAGTQKLGVKWLGPVYNSYQVQQNRGGGGKKGGK